jgi:hypothetical protein
VNPPNFGIVTDKTDPANPITYITATVTYDYDHLFSGITRISSTTLTGRTVMRSE